MDLATESAFSTFMEDVKACVDKAKKPRFQAYMLRALGQPVVATSMKGKIIYWNQEAEKMFGWTENESLGRNVVEFFGNQVFRNEPKVLRCMKTGEPWTGEITVKCRNGELLATILSLRPVFSGQKEPCGVLGVFTNVSDLKWMQGVMEDALQAVAELNEKLRVVDSLTRHDIRNKLAALNGRAYLLKKKIADNPDALTQLEEMESASKQILEILEFEQIYVQMGSEELSEADAGKYVDEAASLFSNLNGAKLINDCHGLMVLADSLLRQLFYNLIDNTLKYGEKVSEIRIHFEEGKDQLRLIYDDDGAGIPDEIRSRLFKEGAGKGTGYGLYLIQRICEEYGWSIQETGRQREGARFVITIPENNKDGKKNYHIE